jgi:hypothetical protein
MTRLITVRISRTGELQAETEGFRGPECLAWIKPLERLLDAEATGSHYTEEFDLVEQQAEAGGYEEQELG